MDDGDPGTAPDRLTRRRYLPRALVVLGLGTIGAVVLLGAYTSGLFSRGRLAGRVIELLEAALAADPSPVSDSTATAEAFGQTTTLVRLDSTAVAAWTRSPVWSWSTVSDGAARVTLLRLGRAGACPMVRRLTGTLRGTLGSEVIQDVTTNCPSPAPAPAR